MLPAQPIHAPKINIRILALRHRPRKLHIRVGKPWLRAHHPPIIPRTISGWHACPGADISHGGLVCYGWSAHVRHDGSFGTALWNDFGFFAAGFEKVGETGSLGVFDGCWGLEAGGLHDGDFLAVVAVGLGTGERTLGVLEAVLHLGEGRGEGAEGTGGGSREHVVGVVSGMAVREEVGDGVPVSGGEKRERMRG